MKYLFKSVIMFFLLTPLFTFAQYPATPGWSWSGHVDHMTFDDEAAWATGIAENATAVGFSVERFQNTHEYTWSVGMNFIFYNDDDEFIQEICDYYGCGDSESDANAISVFAEYGPRYRFGADKLSFFTIRGGAAGMLYSERGISNCSNCHSEDINIDGGLYGLIGVGRTLGAIDVGLQFQQYFSGDIDNVVRLKISGSF